MTKSTETLFRHPIKLYNGFLDDDVSSSIDVFLWDLTSPEISWMLFSRSHQSDIWTHFLLVLKGSNRFALYPLESILTIRTDVCVTSYTPPVKECRRSLSLQLSWGLPFNCLSFKEKCFKKHLKGNKRHRRLVSCNRCLWKLLWSFVTGHDKNIYVRQWKEGKAVRLFPMARDSPPLESSCGLLNLSSSPAAAFLQSWGISLYSRCCLFGILKWNWTEALSTSQFSGGICLPFTSECNVKR